MILGGGIAGLWLLDELLGRGVSAVLLEKHALGAGQTVASQGIIHGGLKYMLDGNITASARAISEMPGLWRDCIAGNRQPNLRGTVVRSDHCCIWGTGSLKSRIFMLGSSIALRTKPEDVPREQWPPGLQHVSGKVMRVGEQVLDMFSLVETLRKRNLPRLMQTTDVSFARGADGNVSEVKVLGPHGATARLQPRTVILTAGQGNAELRQSLGLDAAAMQRRPLHMAMARGTLPELYGHCVEGSKPRLTITSAPLGDGRIVWQLGGLLAEEGVGLDEPALIRRACEEMRTCVPGVDLGDVELAAYRVDRAEAATSTGARPDEPQVLREGNVLTVWPTKLALAPRAAARVMEMMSRDPEDRADHPAVLPIIEDWPAPGVAPPPWEAAAKWYPRRGT